MSQMLEARGNSSCSVTTEAALRLRPAGAQTNPERNLSTRPPFYSLTYVSRRQLIIERHHSHLKRVEG